MRHATKRRDTVGDGGRARLGLRWRAADLVEELASRLGSGGIVEAAAESRDIVAALAGEPRFWPVLHPGAPVAVDLVEQAFRAAELRASGAPFAYAVGRAAFRYLTLEVDPRVLIPRQETELLVDLVLGSRRERRWGVAADVGTGSGAIALSLAAEADVEHVIGTDVSTDALEVARSNETRVRSALRASVEFRAGELLVPLAGEQVDVLVSNPPYLAFEEAAELPASVRDWEPALALLAGGNGLVVTARIVRESPALVRPGGLLALEVDSRRAGAVAELATAAGWRDVTIHCDLTGRDRFVLATRA